MPNRSAETFSQLLHLLRGYPLQIRDEDHRAELLRDCRYFHLKGLEQKLIRHEISFNLKRNKSEITLRLEDIRQSGISIVADPLPVPNTASPSPEPFFSTTQPPRPLVAHIHYARPFVDPVAYELILEIGSSATLLHLPSMRCEFFNETKKRITRLFEVIATKLNLPTSQPLGLLMKKGGASSQPASPGNTPISEHLVRVELGSECDLVLDGKVSRLHLMLPDPVDNTSNWSSCSSVVGAEEVAEPSSKRRRVGDGGSALGGAGADDRYRRDGGVESWIIKTGQWRLRVQNARNGNLIGKKGGVECVLVAVKLDAVTGEAGRNAQKRFLVS